MAPRKGVVATDAEFGTPLGAANLTGAMVITLPESAARRACAASVCGKEGRLGASLQQDEKGGGRRGREEQGRRLLKRRGRRTEAAGDGEHARTRYRHSACKGIAPRTGDGRKRGCGRPSERQTRGRRVASLWDDFGEQM